MGRSLLSAATAAHCSSAVGILIRVPDCDVNLGDEDGVTPLMVASKMGYLKIVDLLLSRSDINVNTQSALHRSTALISSILSGRNGIFARLLSHPGTDVNLRRANGDSPLHVASYMGHDWAVEGLLARKDILPNQRNNWSLTPIDYARMRGHNSTVSLMLPFVTEPWPVLKPRFGPF